MRFVESGGRALTSTSLTVPHCAKSSSSSGAGRDQGRLATYSFRRFSPCSSSAAAGAACDEAATAAAVPGKRRRRRARCWRRGERSGRRGGANWETRGAGSAAAGWGLRASESAIGVGWVEGRAAGAVRAGNFGGWALGRRGLADDSAPWIERFLGRLISFRITWLSGCRLAARWIM